MEDNDLHPEPEPNEPENEHEVDEEGNFLNIVTLEGKREGRSKG